MKYFSRGRLAAFARALSHAVYDKSIEKDRTVYHYFDSDVAFRIVFGFEAERAGLNPHDELIEALLSAGYLGYVHLIRPHAIELNDLIRRHEREASTAVPYDSRVRDYLQSRFLQSNIDRLYESLQTGTPDEKTRRFLDVLRQVGAESFVALELTADPWQQRIRRLSGRVLRLHATGDEMKSLLADPETWRLYKLIGNERRLRDVPINNLSDAAALVSFKRLVAASVSNNRTPVVRFHTTSHAVLSLNDPSLHDALTYDLAQEWKMARHWDAGFIFRSTDYYVIRASFEAVRFPGEEKAESEPPPISLAELDRVLRELTTAVTSNADKDTDKELLQRVEGIQVGNRTLMQVLLDIEHASFLDRLFSGYRVPKSMRDVIDGVNDVLEFLKTGVPRQHLRDGILRDANDLRSRLGDVPAIRQQIEFVDEVEQKVRQLSHSASRNNDFDIRKPMRDLGLVRWGGNVSEPDLDAVSLLVRQLFSDTEREVAFAYLAATIEERLNESRALAICGVLWMLSLFEQVIDLINRLEDSTGSLPPSLNIMRTAARVRTGHSFSHWEKKSHIDALEQMIRDRDESGQLYIGLAYATYYISLSSGEDKIAWSTDIAPDRSQARRVPWAARSYAFAEKAASLLEKNALGRAFAINHCAYVGMQMNLYRERTKQYLEDLENFRDNDEVWHYRFADTIAVTRYRTAHQRWEESLTAPPDEAADLREKACLFLLIAWQILDGAHPYFGDPEIPGHVDDIKLLQKRIGCLKPLGGEAAVDDTTTAPL